MKTEQEIRAKLAEKEWELEQVIGSMGRGSNEYWVAVEPVNVLLWVLEPSLTTLNHDQPQEMVNPTFGWFHPGCPGDAFPKRSES